jgi:FAD synthetase
VFLSFNGGKDCTVLLHLLSQYLKDDLSEVKVIYFRATDPFLEIEEFVKYCETYYQIKIDSVLSATSMKDVLTGICENDKDIKACIMGSRYTDPYCDKLNSLQVMTQFHFL